MRYILILLLAAVSAQADKPADSTEHFQVPPVLHSPKEAFLQGYPQDLDLIVELPAEDVKEVLLLIRFNDSPGYRELPMHFERQRYRYRYDPKLMPADSLEYYFIVTAANGQVYAAPLDSKGNLAPVKRILVDPEEYFKQRNLFK